MRCLIDTSRATSVSGNALDKVMDTVCSNNIIIQEKRACCWRSCVHVKKPRTHFYEFKLMVRISSVFFVSHPSNNHNFAAHTRSIHSDIENG